MAESEETTTGIFFGDSVEANLTTEREKAAYRHNIKERLRHQKIQSILEHVGKHVPKPTTVKKETKAKCLRRVLLYMKYLLQKSEEMKLLPDSAIDPTPSAPKVVHKRGRKRKSESLHKKHFVPKINCRKAQIIFLKKFTSSSFEKLSPNESELNKCPDDDNNSYNAVAATAEASDYENFVTPETLSSISEKFYASSIEEESAVSSINNDEKTFTLKKSFLHSSSLKICPNNFNLNTVLGKKAESLSKNCLQKRNEFNNMKTTNGKSTQIEVSASSEPIKQKRIQRNRMPVFSKKTDDKPNYNDRVLLPNLSKVFTLPSVSSCALGAAPVPSFCPLTAADTISTFSTPDISPVPMDKHSQNFSSSNDLYSSLLSQFYPEDQDGLPSDFLSSSDTTTIPSSNEFISDDTDNISLTKNDSMESPEVYPDIFGSMSSEENQVHRASSETLSDIESFILNESLSKSPGFNASSYVPSSKCNANIYQNLNVLNSEKPIVMSGFDMNYGMSETPSLLNCSFIPQPIGIIPDDLYSFQTNLSELFYMYPNIENTSVMLSSDNEGSQNDDFSPGMNLDFCETFSEPTMYSEAQPSSSGTCDMFKNVKIKEEVIDSLPDEEISGSLNHLGNFSW